MNVFIIEFETGKQRMKLKFLKTRGINNDALLLRFFLVALFVVTVSIQIQQLFIAPTTSGSIGGYTTTTTRKDPTKNPTFLPVAYAIEPIRLFGKFIKKNLMSYEL